jgi:hypothetical protein
MNETMTTKQEQVAAQCKVVAALCERLGGVSGDYAALIERGHLTDLLDMIGKQTAAQMETLGDELNGMDAVSVEEDDWMTPIFKEARRLWPSAVPD